MGVRQLPCTVRPTRDLSGALSPRSELLPRLGDAVPCPSASSPISQDLGWAKWSSLFPFSPKLSPWATYFLGVPLLGHCHLSDVSHRNSWATRPAGKFETQLSSRTHLENGEGSPPPVLAFSVRLSLILNPVSLLSSTSQRTLQSAVAAGLSLACFRC